jgi:predicted Zn-dependent protease
MARRPVAQSRAQANPSPRDQLGLRKAARFARQHFSRAQRALWLLVSLGIITSLLVGAWITWVTMDSPARLIRQAEAASRSNDWVSALRYWRLVNATDAAQGATYLEEARACLALSRAAQAEHSLRKAIAAEAANAEPWRLLLEILRVEDRIVEAQRLGWAGYDRIRMTDRPGLLRELTLGLLVDLPDELVRSTLRRWVDADNTDVDAQVALFQRIAVQPRAADPDRPSLLATLETILSEHPDHVGAREALVSALADSGEPDRGRSTLDAWPEWAHDARYWRLHGRWLLEYDHQPDKAATALRAAVVELPQDWRSWYRLARVFHILGRSLESAQAAETMSRIREVLDPLTLEPRLNAAFDHINNPAACVELAVICDRAGLGRLANAWRAQAEILGQPPSSNP